MNSPFKQRNDPSGSSVPEKQQSQGQLNSAELSMLKEVASTDGMETNDENDPQLMYLLKWGYVTFGPKRGPGGEWFRVELTKKGEKELEAGDTVIEQAAVLSPVVSNAEKAAMVKANVAAERQKAELQKLEGLTTLDWKQIPPPMLAQILVNMPFKGASGEPDYYLQPWQAMVFALRTFELGLSPFSNEVWFNPKNNKVNVTFEGKLKLARMSGMNLSPPVFTRVPADATKPLVAYTCKIKAPHGMCEYTATLKEWMVASSPVWKQKPDHMLQLRAAEKCLSFATGSGSSELMGEQDLQTGKEAETFIPSFTNKTGENE